MKVTKVLLLLLIFSLTRTPHSFALVEERLPTAAPVVNNYVIEYGDTLSEIALAFNLSVQTLLKHNPWINNPNRVPAGYGLQIPLAGVLTGVAATGPMSDKNLVLSSDILNLPPTVVRDIVRDTIPLFINSLPREMNVSEASMSNIMNSVNSAMERVITEIKLSNNLQPNVVRGIIEDSIPLFINSLPREMNVSEASMRRIMTGLNDIEKSIAQLPQNAELKPEVYERISATTKQAIEEGLAPLSSALRPYDNTPWWIWLLIALAFLALTALAFAFVFLAIRGIDRVKGLKTNKKSPDKPVAAGKDNRVVSEPNTDSDDPDEIQEKQKIIALGPSYDTTRPSFEKWLSKARETGVEQACCFRCNTLIMTKNMKRHIFERCEKKPDWALDEVTSPEDAQQQKAMP